MSGENYTNTASTAATAGTVGAADTTATLTSFTGWPSTPFWGEFERGTASAELVRVTGVSGSSITAMTRGQGGTSATTHGAGVSFEHVIPADMPNRFETHSAASTGVHGVSGSIVGTTGSQTLQDKTFRGAHVSQFSDALPAGVASSYLSTADNTNARDGFVHNNTGGSAARAAFKLTQSGTDRFAVSNTGNVTINPSTGTALAVTGNATVSGTTGLAGALTVGAGGASVTGGLTVPSGGINITGTAALAATTASTVSASSTIHANGNIDTDANLIVDGTSTLTGTVTASAGLTVAQGATSWGGRVIISVASTASVTSPTTGDVVYDRSDGMFKRYTGSVWQDMIPGDSQVVSHAGVYTMGTSSATQNLSGGAAAVAISIGNTAVRTNADITWSTSAAGSGSIANGAFSPGRTGWYSIHYTVSWQSPTSDTLLNTYVSADGNTAGIDWFGHERYNSGSIALDEGNGSSFEEFFTAGGKYCLHAAASKAATISNTNRRTRISIRFVSG